jgi:hypothetical protein
MSKRFGKIMKETAARWQETLLNDKPRDMDKLKKILIGKNREMQVFVVDSPLQFYLAQAVIRGRLSKKRAKEYCAILDIDNKFVDDLHKTGGMRAMVGGMPWQRSYSHNIVDNIVDAFSENAYNAMKGIAATTPLPRARFGRQTNDDLFVFGLCDVNRLHREFFPYGAKKELIGIYNHINFNTRIVERSMFSLMSAVSWRPHDIVSGDFNLAQHKFDAVHAEMICKALNCKDPEITKSFEVFHYAPAIMCFRNSYLVLSQRPALQINTSNELHSETDKAVKFADGSGFWFIEGRPLREQGEKIVMSPDKLEPEEITAIQNEEERRIAIDRFGWGKYMAATGAKVINRRDNYVDNTVEVLIKPVNNRESWRQDPLRMVLSCRSTGRKYFIAVPETIANDEKINTCAKAQKWLADGAVTEHLPYASVPLNIVGAS